MNEDFNNKDLGRKEKDATRSSGASSGGGGQPPRDNNEGVSSIEELPSSSSPSSGGGSSRESKASGGGQPPRDNNEGVSSIEELPSSSSSSTSKEEEENTTTTTTTTKAAKDAATTTTKSSSGGKEDVVGIPSPSLYPTISIVARTADATDALMDVVTLSLQKQATTTTTPTTADTTTSSSGAASTTGGGGQPPRDNSNEGVPSSTIVEEPHHSSSTTGGGGGGGGGGGREEETFRRSSTSIVGAHSIAGPMDDVVQSDLLETGLLLGDGTTGNSSSAPAAAAASAAAAANEPQSDHLLIEATLVVDTSHGRSGGGGGGGDGERGGDDNDNDNESRPSLEDHPQRETSESGLSSVISTTLTPQHHDTIVEAKPVKNIWIKKVLLLLLVLVALVATIVAITSSLKNKNNNDNNKSTPSSWGSNNDSDNNTVSAIPTAPLPPPPPSDASNSGTTTTDNDPAAAPSPSPSYSPTATPMPTLQRIRTEGVLRCGVPLEHFSDIFALVPGKENSFDADICRGIAAGVMGRDNYQIELIPLHYSDRIDAVESGRVDMVTAALSWTMDRDVYVPKYGRGLGFASIYTTLSSGFGGIPQYVACAQDGLNYQDDCAGMKICTINGTRYSSILANQVPRGMIKQVERFEDFYPAFEDGTCNVIASTFVNLNFLTMAPTQAAGGTKFASGQGYYSSEPLSIATRKEDRQWMDFCNYIMLSLFAAEYHNITSKNVLLINSDDDEDDDNLFSQPKFRRPTGFGPEYENMFIDAVATAGNYGEMEANRINSVMLQREPINAVNNGTVGIIHSLPLGNTRVEGPSLDEKFRDIIQREKLRCAIRTSGRPGFAQRIGKTSGAESFSGMDVDYCLAIAASIFSPFNTIEFFEVQDDEEGFDLLHRDVVDVFAGVTGDMDRDVKDPGTGVGFSFTSPYFYNSSADGNQRGPDANLCLATREDYTGWHEYVFWIVQATFYAEEENITRFTANEMPMVDLYGERFTRIFRDAISAVGSYGEIYERNVQEYIPRQGLNMLHDKSNPTPLVYIPPGIFQSS